MPTHIYFKMSAKPDRHYLADMISCNVKESGRVLEAAAEVLTHDQLARQAEDALAEAHFTTARRKDAEVNEGGLVETTL
jgi:hypothetical protein